MMIRTTRHDWGNVSYTFNDVKQVQQIVIDAALIGWNEMLRQKTIKRRNWVKYNDSKARFMYQMAGLLDCQGITPINRAVFIFNWREKNKKRDPDNVIGATKWIFDALVKHGRMRADGWRQVAGFEHIWQVADVPGVTVDIIEV